MDSLSFIFSGKTDQKYATPGFVTYGYVQSPSYSYKGIITPTGNQGANLPSEVRLVDQSIIITTIGKQMREEALKAWGSLSNSTFAFGTVTLLTGIIMGGLIAAKMLALPFIAPAILLALIGIRSLYCFAQADSKLEMWKDPIDAIAKSRRDCDPANEGFSKLRKNKIDINLVHKEEIKHIWWETVENQRNQLSIVKNSKNENVKEKFVNQFFTPLNPLSKESISFAFVPNEQINNPLTHTLKDRQQVDNVSDQFEKYQIENKDIRNNFEEWREEINKEKNDFIDENQKNWDNALKKDKLTMNYYIESYKKTKDQDLEPFEKEKTKKIDEANEKYKNELKRINQNYPESQRIKQKDVDEEFNRLKKAAKNERDESIKKANDHYNDSTKHIFSIFESNARTAKYIYEMATTPFNIYYQGEKDKIENKAKEILKNLKEKETEKLTPMITSIEMLYSLYDQNAQSVPSLYPNVPGFTFDFSYIPSAPTRDEIYLNFPPQLQQDVDQNQFDAFTNFAYNPNI